MGNTANTSDHIHDEQRHDLERKRLTGGIHRYLPQYYSHGRPVLRSLRWWRTWRASPEVSGRSGQEYARSPVAGLEYIGRRTSHIGLTRPSRRASRVKSRHGKCTVHACRAIVVDGLWHKATLAVRGAARRMIARISPLRVLLAGRRGRPVNHFCWNALLTWGGVSEAADCDGGEVSVACVGPGSNWQR